MAGPRRDILLDSNGNRLLVAGDYGFAEGNQAVKQGIECRVKLFEGEYWLNQALGVPWLTDVLIKNPKPIIVKSVIGQAIADTPDVSQVVNVSYEVAGQTRRGAVSYTAVSNAGTITGTVTS